MNATPDEQKERRFTQGQLPMTPNRVYMPPAPADWDGIDATMTFGRPVRLRINFRSWARVKAATGVDGVTETKMPRTVPVFALMVSVFAEEAGDPITPAEIERHVSSHTIQELAEAMERFFKAAVQIVRLTRGAKNSASN